MIHRYDVHRWGREDVERSGVHVSLPLILLAFLIVSLLTLSTFYESNKVYRINDLANQATNKNLEEKYNNLLDKYQGAMCWHRKLVVTQVENTKLCMDPDTKALFKIERDKPEVELWGRVPLGSDRIKNLWPQD